MTAQPTWPWWLGALWLAGVVLLYRVAAGRYLGVSGFLGRLSGLRAEMAHPVEAAPRALSREAAPPRRLPWQAPLAFLVALAAGGLLARIGPGGPDLHGALGSLGRADWRGATVLLIGGLLVGFGARMAGGCTSGHGLSGCGRLDRGSLLATACFFTTAVVVDCFLRP